MAVDAIIGESGVSLFDYVPKVVFLVQLYLPVAILMSLFYFLGLGVSGAWLRQRRASQNRLLEENFCIQDRLRARCLNLSDQLSRAADEHSQVTKTLAQRELQIRDLHIQIACLKEVVLSRAEPCVGNTFADKMRPHHSIPENGEKDNLTEIRGIGGILEKELHRSGVYRFEQIAQWTPDDIKQFVADLPFGDRVTRDRWVDQARKLHESKHGQSLVQSTTNKKL